MMKYLFATIFLLSGFSLSAHNLQPQDSTGYTLIDGKYYILHKVDKGQGLFSVARRYNSSVDAITAANPEVKDGLTTGQILKVPIDYVPEEAKKANKPEPLKKEETRDKIHIVQTGETLYRISVNHKISVEEVKKWNNLANNNLEVGQKLIVGKEQVVQAGNEHRENYGGEEKKKTEEKAEIKQPDLSKYEYNKMTGEVKESGLCIIAEEESIDHDRSFALHPTAAPGTIIMVTNTQNNKSVFVRVVGKLESSKNGETLLKLSKASGDRLGMTAGEKIQVKLNYAR